MTRLLLVAPLLVISTALAAPQAIEIGKENVKDLPGGREADGIIGDFVLRNDRIEAVISGNLPNRKANMGTLWEAATPGCLYDLCPRGSNNDQLTYLGPGRQCGPLSSVRIIKDGSDGEAVVRAELTAAAGNGLAKSHDYILRDGWSHLLIVSSYENTTSAPINVRLSPEVKGLVGGGVVDEVIAADCQDPADRLGYAVGPIKMDGIEPAVGKIDLKPGQTIKVASAVAVGEGSLATLGAIQKLQGKPVRPAQGRITESEDRPANGGRLVAKIGPKEFVSFVSDEGRFAFDCPDSVKELSYHDIGRPAQVISLGGDKAIAVRVPAASTIRLKITDANGGPIPCKVQFIGIDGTKTPDLGPVIRAHGCDNQYHSENGSFTQALPFGKYRVVITHGVEFDHVERTVEVKATEQIEITAQLRRVVDTTGWISADFHNHSTPSGDNYCGTDDRMINLAAEHVEFAPATEHNRIYEWQSHIDRLGLKPFLATITGMELTGPGPHLNAFPLERVPYTQSNGAPEWDPDPRISAILLRRFPGDVANRWVQLNHPSVSKFFNDADGDRKADGGFKHLESFIDAAEVYSEGILSGRPLVTVNSKKGPRKIENRAFAWLQLLNAGRRVWTIAVSDAHEVTQGGVGGWRLYVPSSHDDPPQIDYKEIITHAKAGHTFVTTGPFLQAKTADGHGPGDTIASRQPIKLQVRVQCNTWTDVDRVAVMVNGKVDSRFDFRRSSHPQLFHDATVRFEHAFEVPLEKDAHLIVVAVGEKTKLTTGYGQSWQSELNPIAYHNPIFVDVDGGGFQPNGDTLGHPFLRATGEE